MLNYLEKAGPTRCISTDLQVEGSMYKIGRKGNNGSYKPVKKRNYGMFEIALRLIISCL